MKRFTPYQRSYLVGSSILSVAALSATLSVALRQQSSLVWLLSAALAIVYAIAWVQNEEFETPTAKSPVLIAVSDTALLAALCLVGAVAVPTFLVTEAVARWYQRRGVQPLGYLFNFNRLNTTSLVTLAALQLLTGGDLRAFSPFPEGTIRCLLILLVFELFDRAYSALREATGSIRPVIAIFAGEARPITLVTAIPPAMGVLIATAAVVAPGLTVPMLIPVILSRYAIRAIARWSQSHALLQQQVAEQTEAIRAQAAQIEAQEQARHQHTVLLVHDLEKEFRLGERLMGNALTAGGLTSHPRLPAPELSAALTEIAAIFERGLAMSADILLGSTLRAGQATFQPAPINLTALVAAVTSRYLPVATAAEVQLTFDCDAVTRLNVDGPKLDRALANLLNNAIDYTKGCPVRTVTVSLSSTTDAVQIRVSDTGIGIEPDAIAQIGQRFTRLAVDHQAHHGNGLGLYGVAAIVDMHSGAIQVTSPGRNQGTTVTITLPTSETLDQSVPSQPIAASQVRTQ